VYPAPSASCSRSIRVKEPTDRSSRIVHHSCGVKGWLASTPSVDAVRPGRCPECGAASRPTGGKLGLHGHGLRERQVRGPLDPDGPSVCVTVACRRFRCEFCKAIVMVVPRGVAPHRHYGYAAIAMAFTLWMLVGMPVTEVRRRVCAWPISDESPSRWPTLRRWARAARAALGCGSPDRAAARWAQIAIGNAPTHLRDGPLWAQAFAGGNAMP